MFHSSSCKSGLCLSIVSCRYLACCHGVLGPAGQWGTAEPTWRLLRISCSVSPAHRCCQGSGTSGMLQNGISVGSLASSSSGSTRLQGCPGCQEGEWYLTPQVIGVGWSKVLHHLAVPLLAFPLLRSHPHLRVMERCCST